MIKDVYKSLIMLSILPLIYISTSFEMALLAGLVLLVVSLSIKALSLWLGHFVHPRIALYTYILLSAALVTIFTIIYGTFFSTNQLLGIYLSLILVNVSVIGNEEEPLEFMKHLWMSLIGFGILLVIGLLREVLGTGSFELSIFGLDAISIFDAEYGIGFLKEASGGYVLAGIIFAVVQGIQFKTKEVDHHVV